MENHIQDLFPQRCCAKFAGTRREYPFRNDARTAYVHLFIDAVWYPDFSKRRGEMLHDLATPDRIRDALRICNTAVGDNCAVSLQLFLCHISARFVCDRFHINA